MIDIVSVNTNGIRAANRKGFFNWLASEQPDVVCVQEVRAQEEQLNDPVFYPDGYHCYYFDAQKKGYSGTAIYSRVKPRQVIKGLGWDPADSEGRYIQADYQGLSVISLYMPSGSSSDAALERKFRFMDQFYQHLKSLKRKRRNYVICADWNICHREIDLKNWKANQKNSGFLPQERAWLSQVMDELGFVDSFRVVNKQAEQYTWWSNRGRAWDNNVGWRLDYQLVSPALVPLISAASIYTDERFSDHAPQIMRYDLVLENGQ